MINASCYSEVKSPLGVLTLTGNGEALTGLYMEAQKHRPALPRHCVRDDTCFASVREQLAAYFAGELRSFDVPLAGSGTDFQQRVWQALRDIPYGVTESYGALAARIGKPAASRAVGMANGRNPIGIIVPCHRVLGVSGALTGYGGGLARKQWLLAHEQAMAGLF
ncbi:MAG: methylated-DNA--[protein]-cysteine S-methyltransferase [Pseudohongiella sp.]|uniref:methylated-DNA--[protein]-cysteine S-methyltransferase n=1 Tax=Pseudohongiella sp. TaxID=1979412 RepID=UPI0034A04AB4